MTCSVLLIIAQPLSALLQSVLCKVLPIYVCMTEAFLSIKISRISDPRISTLSDCLQPASRPSALPGY